VSWTDAFVVLAVSHLVGDFLFQTEWQASNKWAGLGSDPVARRALFSHIATYSLAFIPALVWLAVEHGVRVVPAALLIVVTHLIQDDGRALRAYIVRVKHSEVTSGGLVAVAADQSFHAVFLLAAALAAAA
jgi:hypothetical protein